MVLARARLWHSRSASGARAPTNIDFQTIATRYSRTIKHENNDQRFLDTTVSLYSVQIVDDFYTSCQFSCPSPSGRSFHPCYTSYELVAPGLTFQWSTNSTVKTVLIEKIVQYVRLIQFNTKDIRKKERVGMNCSSVHLYWITIDA